MWNKQAIFWSLSRIASWTRDSRFGTRLLRFLLLCPVLVVCNSGSATFSVFGYEAGWSCSLFAQGWKCISKARRRSWDLFCQSFQWSLGCRKRGSVFALSDQRSHVTTDSPRRCSRGFCVQKSPRSSRYSCEAVFIISEAQLVAEDTFIALSRHTVRQCCSISGNILSPLQSTQTWFSAGRTCSTVSTAECLMGSLAPPVEYGNRPRSGC